MVCPSRPQGMHGAPEASRYGSRHAPCPSSIRAGFFFRQAPGCGLRTTGGWRFPSTTACLGYGQYLIQVLPVGRSRPLTASSNSGQVVHPPLLCIYQRDAGIDPEASLHLAVIVGSSQRSSVIPLSYFTARVKFPALASRKVFDQKPPNLLQGLASPMRPRHCTHGLVHRASYLGTRDTSLPPTTLQGNLTLVEDGPW
ncbi:hypothetical protein LX36DRAFT_365272 [Colletotrichum falcatum]|nr:hypothetical protein LX36DRAFT_365272 [Colletotrichum falcatum]